MVINKNEYLPNYDIWKILLKITRNVTENFGNHFTWDIKVSSLMECYTSEHFTVNRKRKWHFLTQHFLL